MLFYATPILYSPEIFANTPINFIFKLNPLSVIITAYRDIIFYKNLPNFVSIASVFIFSLLILMIGILIFRKLEKGFAEEV